MNQPLIPAPVPVRNETPAARPAINQAPADQLDVVTSIRSTRPATVGKRYELVGGEVVKHQIANISEGVAQSHVIGTADTLADLLRQVTERTDTALCPALWNGDDGQPFDLVTEAELARITGHPVGSQEMAGVLNREGRRRVAARLRRGLRPSVRLLLDADTPPGMPADWAAWTMEQRIAKLAEIIPGLDRCERVQLRGSSARVVAPGGQPGGATHAYITVTDPNMIAILKAWLSVAMVTEGLSFQSPRFSRTDGSAIGHAHRTVFDLSVLDPGRLIFCSKPSISEAMEAAGYKVVDANVEIVNPGGGPLDVSGIQMPDADMLAEYHRITGERITYSNEATSVAIRSVGLLTMATEIESDGAVQTFGQWLATMAAAVAAAPNETAAEAAKKLRCEAPFRDSKSKAAFIKWTGPEAGYVHDIGNTTTYLLDVEAIRAADVAELGERLNAVVPPEAIADELASQAPAREAEALTTAAAAAQAAQGERVPVLCEDGDEHQALDKVLAELHRLKPPVFRGGEGLVYVSRSREVRVFDDEGRATKVKTIGMETVRTVWLTHALARIVVFKKTQNRTSVRASGERVTTSRLKNVTPPKLTVQGVLDADDIPVPTISGIISTPTMRPNGSILDANGFDETTGFWLDHDLTLAIPERPTRRDALRAFATLRKLLSGFPMTAMSETVAIAHMMGAVLRPAFPSMPGLMIEAPVAGSGKSYLTKTIGYLAHGIVPAVSNWPKSDEELVKHLHSMLLAGVPFIAIDNANRTKITGNLICSMLTEPRVKIRPLGASKDITVSTTGVVFTVNGNHPRLAEDTTQRFMTCYINPETASPRERDFTSDPLDMLRRDRGRFVSAVLTIARAYIVAGRPGVVSYGSFEAWSKLVRSSLLWLVGDDVLQTTRDAIAEDPETQTATEVVRFILAHRALDVRFTVAELVAAVQATDAMQLRVLGGLVGATGAGDRLATDDQIKKKAGQYFDSHLRDAPMLVDHAGGRIEVKLVRDGMDRTRVARWKLTRVRVVSPSPPGGEDQD